MVKEAVSLWFIDTKMYCNKSIIKTECTGMRIDKQPHGIEERPETPIHTKSPCLQGSSNHSLAGEQMVSGDGNRIVKWTENLI